MKKYAVLTFVVALFFGGLLAWNWLRDNKLPAFGCDCDLYVYPDTPVEALSDTIAMRASAKWPSRLRKVLEKHEVGKYCKPGHYFLQASRPAVYVARMLNNGWQTPVKMTLSGTLRLKGDIARKISAQMMVDSSTVRAAFEDAALLSEFGTEPSKLFSLLMPDTYEMYWTDDVRAILKRQKEAQDAFWTADNLEKARKLGLTESQVSIVASIVSSESNYAPEFSRIAGVYLNRLRKGMKLQADPTIAFCYDYKVNRILNYMLQVDSPYNTYKNGGLPPGPICVPSKKTLEAVLNPDFGNGNLYFCADPSFNGSHRFARTYTEHLRNARAFQQALNNRQSQKK